MHTYVQYPQRLEMLNSLRLGVQKGVSHLWGVLGTELRFSEEQQGFLPADPSVQLPLDNFLQNCGYGQTVPYKAHWQCDNGHNGSRRRVTRVKVESASGGPQESFTIMGTRAETASEPHQNPTTLLPQSQIPVSTTRKNKFQMPKPLGLWYFVIENCNDKCSRIISSPILHEILKCHFCEHSWSSNLLTFIFVQNYEKWQCSRTRKGIQSMLWLQGQKYNSVFISF